MRNTFFNKVTFERKIIQAVNSSGVNSVQLPGLSRSAIETWLRKTSLENATEFGDHLMKLGALCQVLSDRSNESFLPLQPDTEARINVGLAELESMLRRNRG